MYTHIYIYIYAGELVGCPPFSGIKASWLSTPWPAGCPPSFSHYKIGVWGHVGFFLPTFGFGEFYGSGSVSRLVF